MELPARYRMPWEVDEHHPDSDNPWKTPYSSRPGRQGRNDYSAFISKKRRASSPPREDGSSLTVYGGGIDSHIYQSTSPSTLSEPIFFTRVRSIERSNEPYVCECCPKKPKRFDTKEELEKHKQEKRYECAYCPNRFKNQNEAERHVNSLHLRRHSWSCSNLSGYEDSFHPSSVSLGIADTCGYCGEDFPRSGVQGAATKQDWEVRIKHLQEVHKYGECNRSKKFFRADHFRQHLKHRHAGRSGKWTNVLENACMTGELLPEPIRGRQPCSISLLPPPKHVAVTEFAGIDIKRDDDTHLPTEASMGSEDVDRPLKTFASESNKTRGQARNTTLENFDSTDAKTSVSKDSGYSSMVSKAPRVKPNNELETGDGCRWDSESVASVQSLGTVDTMSSINPTAAGGAVEQLAETLIKDESICSLIVKGYEHFDSDRFERNLRRLLKLFAFGLQKEAHTSLEKSAIRIVYTYRAYVVRIIRKRLELAEDDHAITMDELQKQKTSQIALERFLKHLPGAEETNIDCRSESESDNDSELDDGSDLDDEDQPYLPNLEKVKLYLLNSAAYSELKQHLADFVRLSDPKTLLLKNGEPMMFELEIEEPVLDKGSTSEFLHTNSNLNTNYPQFGSTSLNRVQFEWKEHSKIPQQQAGQSENRLWKMMFFIIITIIFLPLTFFTGTFGMNSRELNSSRGLFALPCCFKAPVPLSLVVLSLLGAFLVLAQSLARYIRACLIICLEQSGIRQQWVQIRYSMGYVLTSLRRKTSPETSALEVVNKQHSLHEAVSATDRGKVFQSLTKNDLLSSQEPLHGIIEGALISMEAFFTSCTWPENTSQLSLTLQNWWVKSTRKVVAANKSRIEWKCACGHDLYADFQTKSLSKLEEYSAILKSTTSSSSQSNTNHSPVTPITTPAAAHLLPSNINLRARLSSKSQNSSGTTLQAVGSGNVSKPSYLELCVNTGAHLKTLGEIDLATISTDGALFEAIKKRYLQLRGFRSKFWLLKPAAVSFVRFSLENRHRVGILQKPLALPPKSEVDAKKWIYDPCPLEGDPPIAADLFLHYFQCSEGSSILFWMLRFPRKLETSLLTTAGASATFGWGIHIDEGPDFAVLFKVNLFILCLSGLAAGLWKLFESDFQGAFGFACWIIAVLNSLLMAYMFKWKQE